MTRIPYTYRIELNHTNHFYYGVQYGKNANPANFWTTYFTSSNTIKNLIKEFGIDAFKTEIINIYTSDNVDYAIAEEYRLIDLNKNNPLCLNGNNGGKILDPNVGRRIKGSDGLSSYDKSGLKLSNFINSNTEYKNKLIVNITDWRNDEAKVQSAKQKYKETLDNVKENGLTLREEKSIRMLGDNNPSKISENRDKISHGNKQWYINNPEEANKLKEKIKDSMQSKDENGLSAHDRHSIFMQEHNTTKNTIWVNNNIINLRCLPDMIPDGFIKGRLVKEKLIRNSFICPHCNKEGKGPNMKRYHFNNCKLIKGEKC